MSIIQNTAKTYYGLNKRPHEKYGFKEGIDFCLINLSSKWRGGHNRKDYIITLDMAKNKAHLHQIKGHESDRRNFALKIQRT